MMKIQLYSFLFMFIIVFPLLADELSTKDKNSEDNKQNKSVNYGNAIIKIGVHLPGTNDLGLLFGHYLYDVGHIDSNIIEKENRVNSNYQNIHNRKTMKDTSGYEFDLMIFINNFENSNIKIKSFSFGLKGRYTHVNMESFYSNLNTGKDYINDLLYYKFISCGPQFNFIFKSYESVDWYFHGYIIGGYVYKGTLNATHGSADLDKNNYRTGVHGYNITYGLGINFSVNQRWIPITIGNNIYYSDTRLKMAHALAVYEDNDRDIYLKSWGFELVIGLYLSWGHFR